jgi:N-methylhydantoinase A/oxoprolinase/acetone carboxylase beta subunit
MRVAIDTGGTFTDCLFLRDGRIEILKLPSTPGNPAQAIANAPEQWEHYGIHAERGEESIELIVRMIVGHDPNHIQQIERMLAPKRA